ncbi:MAG: sigma-70 family RNA polymerase sigma factor [Clostridia bacterium]|nr:sigma-70 family RNA polymerase sigma factor [Clostridia bacterium]
MGGPDKSDLELIEAIRGGDGAALEQMALKHDPLVHYVVKRFEGRGRERDDLVQLGRLGLVKAIRNFDPRRYQVRFSTYAVPLIMGEIRRFLRDDSQVHVARSIRENAIRLARLREELGDGATLETLAQRLGLSHEDALLAMEAGYGVRSLSEPLGDGDLLRQDTIGEDDTARLVSRIDLRTMLDSLPPRERELIRRRYFLDQTQTSIAAELGMTQVQVSRMESRILKRLRGMGGN